ncbi:MAG: hypothetical protein H7259_11270 [Cytophagales bacterium]|nr:hypothetical protein [Cytophaga sp.]
MNLNNPNRWFLLISSLIMILIATASYVIPSSDIPFATEGIFVHLFRINYGIIAWMFLLGNSLMAVRAYLIITGWVLIYLVIANWLDLPPENLMHLTSADNVLNVNLGIISIFVGIMFGDKTNSDKEVPKKGSRS